MGIRRLDRIRQVIKRKWFVKYIYISFCNPVVSLELQVKEERVEREAREEKLRPQRKRLNLDRIEPDFRFLRFEKTVSRISNESRSFQLVVSIDS